jgi:predicted transcriptional regulator
MSKPIDEPMYIHRTQASRRRDVINLLTEHPEYSDRRITRIAVVSRELVTKIRRNLIRLSKIESRHARQRVGADGKTYKRLPQPRENRP